MKEEEARRVAEFLVQRHQPLSDQGPATNIPTAPKPISAPSKSSQQDHFVPRVGALCPKCEKAKLVRKNVKRSDGTETDFLACNSYPKGCDAIFPVVALTYKAVATVAGKPTPVKVTEPEAYKAGDPCPRCKNGLLVQRKSKTAFLGCSNYPQCRFTDYRQG